MNDVYLLKCVGIGPFQFLAIGKLNVGIVIHSFCNAFAIRLISVNI